MTKIGEIPIKTRRWMRLVFAAREPGVCRVCGCTETDACHNPRYGNCWWADYDMTLCSHCAEMEIFMDKRTVHRVRSAKTDYRL